MSPERHESSLDLQGIVIRPLEKDGLMVQRSSQILSGYKIVRLIMHSMIGYDY